MTSRSRLRREAALKGEPAPEFTTSLSVAETTPSAPEGGESAGPAPAGLTAVTVPAAAPPISQGGGRDDHERADGAAACNATPPAPGPAPASAPAQGAEGGTPGPPSEARSRNAPAAAPGSGSRGTPSSRGVAGEETAGPGTPVPGPAPASPRAVQGHARGENGTAGGARSSAAPPAAGEEFRRKWKAASSANAAARRAGRSQYPVKRPGDGYTPGGTRRMPPPSGGAT